MTCLEPGLANCQVPLGTCGSLQPFLPPAPSVRALTEDQSLYRRNPDKPLSRRSKEITSARNVKNTTKRAISLCVAVKSTWGSSAFKFWLSVSHKAGKRVRLCCTWSCGLLWALGQSGTARVINQGQSFEIKQTFFTPRKHTPNLLPDIFHWWSQS